MIPLRLTLKNFMSYGEEGATLPFEELHVACLSGDNGNGKSALLDAITWSLWGKTRASSSGGVTEDDLIRTGADDVEVRFEFEMDAQRYRVVRKRKRGRAGSEWQLTQADGNGAYVPIGGGSQRETGKQLVQLLNMEYETFLNSAYLQQGHADEFARQTPAKRKGILGEILGLDRYDRLETKAKERFKDRKELADDLEQQIRMLEGHIGRLPDYENQLAEVRAALEALEQERTAQEKTTASLRDRHSKLDALAHRVTDGEAVCLKMEADIAQRDRELCDRLARLRTLAELLEQKQSILSDYAALQTARERREQLEPEVAAFNKVLTELQAVVATIDLEKTRLEGELRSGEVELRGAEQRQREHAGLQTQITTLEAALKEGAPVAAKLAAAQAEQERLQQEFSDLNARNRELDASLAEVADVLEMLERPHAQCPVCESDLSGTKHQRVLERQKARQADLQAQKDDVRKTGIATKKALAEALETTQNLLNMQQELAARRSQCEQLRARQKELADAESEAATWQERVQKLRVQLERGEFAGPKRVIRQRLEQDRDRLGLARAEYETAHQRVQQLEPSQKRYLQLQQAEGNWDQEVAEKERLELLLAARRAELTEARQKLEGLRGSLEQFEAIKRELAVAEAELARLQKESNNLRVQEGSLLSYIQGCEQARQDRKQREAEFKKVDEERRMYQALATAFGKKGVQALIIENAIPELEEEANHLLARMTDNAMQIRFETTRSAKSSGNEIETLDIKIDDGSGTRPYELFSGGEAFRINFAVRIALSRLLAHRSGARLQTLILDEGFGTQDGKGREKLVEVIETIKDDFEKIIVITHVEDLKDAFAQRIEVTKDATGSHIHFL